MVHPDLYPNSTRWCPPSYKWVIIPLTIDRSPIKTIVKLDLKTNLANYGAYHTTMFDLPAGDSPIFFLDPLHIPRNIPLSNHYYKTNITELLS